MTTLYEIPEVLSMAIRVMNNEFGVDDERRTKIESLGYNYTEVQGCVNTIAKYWEK